MNKELFELTITTPNLKRFIATGRVSFKFLFMMDVDFYAYNQDTNDRDLEVEVEAVGGKLLAVDYRNTALTYSQPVKFDEIENIKKWYFRELDKDTLNAFLELMPNNVDYKVKQTRY